MKIVNLTGHPLVLGKRASRLVTIRSSGRTRVSARYSEVDLMDVGNGVLIPVLELHQGDTYSLPEPEAGTLYVVSGLVAGRVRRNDVVAPARLSRTRDGRVEYARAFMRYPKEE